MPIVVDADERQSEITVGSTLEYFLNVGTIFGDSDAAGHEDEFVALGYEFDVLQLVSASQGGGSSGGEPALSPLYVDLDPHVPGLAKLIELAATGSSLPEVVFTISKPGAGGDFQTVTLTDVKVLSYDEGTGFATRVAFSYAKVKLEIKELQQDGTPGDSQVFEYNLASTEPPPDVNSAPQGSDNSITLDEDGTYVFTVADFGFSDPSDTPANGLLSVKITATPLAGSLSRDGVPVAAGTSVAVADITAGKLKFTPLQDGNGTAYANLKFQVQDDGGTANGGVDTDATANTLTINVNPINDAPTAVILSNTTPNVTENSSTATAIRVADIEIADVDEGTNVLSLAGADADLFEVAAGALFLKAGSALDFETKTNYAVTVNVNDSSVGATPDASANFTLNVTDINEVPGLAFSGVRAAIAENTSTATRIKIADILVTDDALGSETIKLTGADASLFEIFDGDLYLKAGAKLDFESNPKLDVTVNVNDPTVGSVVDVSKALRVAVTDVKETLRGTSGNDRLAGGVGEDRILGLIGKDTISGGAGKDVLQGGGGADRMTGGADADTFVFTSTADSAPGATGFINNTSVFNRASGAGARDVITDFTPGEDRIDLSAIDANTKLAGNQAFKFLATAAFTSTPGGLVYRKFNEPGSARDVTIVYGDVDGDKLADFQIELLGLKTLTAADFIL